ncbi:NAD-dependent protein deacetylase HST2 [Candida viswanathii]|uniref:NAD-dependent protein deacetylase n=1 Tax=Candida viswanathii TaxID=5486 RepID=A0A367Y171_9ASCO|nr:NAD-dependent protein deacetylase HST2 [Candida viswanathii]
MSDIEVTLKPIAEAIKNGKKVTFFNGAGISTSAGIPDFRSPDTGLYANLAKLDLPFAEAVFDIDYFKENPKPFYTLAEELYPGNFAPTKFHYFIKLLQDQNSLRRVYTQNIDTLERLAGVEDKYIVEAHGSFARNHCVDCHKEMDTETLRQHMKDSSKDGIPTCEHCHGYVKPDIVFFGEGLPADFFEKWDHDSHRVEVAIVAGTSLTVQPFAFLPAEVSKKSIRLLVNKEKVGDFQHHPRKSDVLALHDCDLVAEKLCALLGLEEKLNELYEAERVKYGKHEDKEIVLHDIEDRLKEDANLKEEVTNGETKDGAKKEEVKEEAKKDEKEETELEKLIDKLSL